MTTYLDADGRFLGLDDEQADPDEARVVVVPVPYEATSSYGGGSAAGPAAILDASHQVELYDLELGFEPWAAAGGIATLRPLGLDGCGNGEAVMERLERVVAEQLERRRIVVTLGGEHTAVVGAIRAHVRAVQPLTVLQLDAHADLRESYQGDRWNHACALARVLDVHDDIVQVGIRSGTPDEVATAHRHGIPIITGADVRRATGDGVDWIEPIIERCSANVYVTLDCDVFDPAVMPATGTPEPGGLSWTQVDELVRRLCAARRVVGFDVSELAPIAGLRLAEFGIAKLVARFVGYIGAGAPDGDRARPAPAQGRSR